jgi:hypothetical protein
VPAERRQRRRQRRERQSPPLACRPRLPVCSFCAIVRCCASFIRLPVSACPEYLIPRPADILHRASLLSAALPQRIQQT